MVHQIQLRRNIDQIYNSQNYTWHIEFLLLHMLDIKKAVARAELWPVDTDWCTHHWSVLEWKTTNGSCVQVTKHMYMWLLMISYGSAGAAISCLYGLGSWNGTPHVGLPGGWTAKITNFEKKNKLWIPKNQPQNNTHLISLMLDQSPLLKRGQTCEKEYVKTFKNK